MVKRTADLENVGQLYWVSGGRMFRVTAIATRVDEANHYMQDNGGQVLTQTPACELILISDDDKGTKIAFRG